MLHRQARGGSCNRGVLPDGPVGRLLPVRFQRRQRRSGASCIGNHYGDELDGGLEKDEAWKILQYLPGDERDNRLSSISVIRHAPAGSNLVRSTILNSAIMSKIADLIKFNSTET